jgi:molybdate transport system regulatory protein
MVKISTRNQFHGTVASVQEGAVNAEVVLDVGHGDQIVSIITNGSVHHLGLTAGKQAIALVKASAVILMVGDGKTSARNRFCGPVTACKEGAVNGEVTIGLKGGNTITAIITNESIRKLGLGVGVEVCALVKASNVILAVGD